MSALKNLAFLLAVFATAALALQASAGEPPDEPKPAGEAPKKVGVAKMDKQLAVLLDDIDRLKQELLPSEGLAGPRRAKQAPPPGQPQRPSASPKTVCEKSLALATLGYRVLCNTRPVLAAAAARNENAHEQEAKLKTQQKQQASQAGAGAAEPATGGPGEGAELAPHASRSFERLNAFELAANQLAEEQHEPRPDGDQLERLQGLWERLSRRGQFRSLVEGREAKVAAH